MKTFGEYVTRLPCPSSRNRRASAHSSSRGASSRAAASTPRAYVATPSLGGPLRRRLGGAAERTSGLRLLVRLRRRLGGAAERTSGLRLLVRLHPRLGSNR